MTKTAREIHLPERLYSTRGAEVGNRFVGLQLPGGRRLEIPCSWNHSAIQNEGRSSKVSRRFQGESQPSP